VRTLFQLPADATGAIQIYVRPEALRRVEEIAQRLRDALNIAGYQVMEPAEGAFWMKLGGLNGEDWTGQRVDVTTWQDEVSFLSWTLTLLRTVIAVLMVVLTGIVITGITNTIWIAIRERTREIGTLRAIGMQRGAVLRMFLFEVLLLALAGAGAGAAAGRAVVALLNAVQPRVPADMQTFLMSERVRLVVPAGSLALAVAGITVITVLAAIYPCVRAARLQPVSAMSHFG
jgi:ABC-type lipoprotein release transport system permease subunit